MGRTITATADLRDEGRTLGEYLKTELALTKAQIRRLKYQEDGLLVNGQKERVTYRLRAGDRLEIRAGGAAQAQPNVTPVEHELRILYEDEDLIAVWKTAGELVHPVGIHKEDSLANYLAAYFQKKGEPVQTIRSIGRLDKDTAGVVVFAKNRLAAARLWKQKEQGLFTKEYLARCEGTFSGAERKAVQTIDMPIGKCAGHPGKMCVDSAGKPAVTHYQVRRDGLVRIWLETGRTHQIRVHMAYIGHPLVGDALYGHGVRLQTYAALCAYRAVLWQPFSNEKLILTEDGLIKS